MSHVLREMLHCLFTQQIVRSAGAIGFDTDFLGSKDFFMQTEKFWRIDHIKVNVYTEVIFSKF